MEKKFEDNLFEERLHNLEGVVFYTFLTLGLFVIAITYLLPHIDSTLFQVLSFIDLALMSLAGGRWLNKLVNLGFYIGFRWEESSRKRMEKISLGLKKHKLAITTISTIIGVALMMIIAAWLYDWNWKLIGGQLIFLVIGTGLGALVTWLIRKKSN